MKNGLTTNVQMQKNNSYLDALRVFNNCKTDVSREYYFEQNMIYKRLLSKNKCSYKHRRLEEIKQLRLSKPRAFWKYFRKKNQKSKESISLNDFFTYFSNLENDIFTCRNEESENLCNGVKLSSVSSLS